MYKKLFALFAASIFFLPAMAVELPEETQWEENAEANRAFVKDLFTPSWKKLFKSEDSNDDLFDLALQNASPIWLGAIQYFVQHPDARLFMLADPGNFGNEAIAKAAIYNRWIESAEELFPKVNAYEFKEKKNHTVVRINFNIDLNHSEILTYTAIPQADKSIMGVLESSVSDRYMTSTTTEFSRFVNGQFRSITPQLKEKDFFRSQGFVYPPTKENDEALAGCEMYIHFKVNLQANPITLLASLQQANPDHYTPAFICTAECKIPFTWNGKNFIAGKKHCLKKGKWGVSRPSYEL